MEQALPHQARRGAARVRAERVEGRARGGKGENMYRHIANHARALGHRTPPAAPRSCNYGRTYSNNNNDQVSRKAANSVELLILWSW